jgi:transcriptional regulator with XRE-family HTH domain
VAEEKKNPLGPVGEYLRRNVERIREARGLNKKDLSDAVAGLGRPIPPLGISRVEAGTRRVDADDLVALAIALNVSPNALLLPPKWTDEQVQIAPGLSLNAKTAWLWAEGRAPASDYGTSGEIVVTDEDTQEAEDAKDAAYWAQREAYEALTHPPERRRAARHGANRAARQASTAVDHLVTSVLSGDKDAAARQLKAAKLRLRQLETEVAQLELELEGGA